MNQRHTARIVLLNNENKIILLKFVEPNRSFWLTPGGKIEQGETPLQAARRELYEETGITAAEFALPHSWYYEGITPLHGVPTLFKEHIFLARTYTLQTTSAYLNEDEKEIISEYKWWDLNALIASREIFYPQGLAAALKPVVYHNSLPSGTIILTH